MLQALRISNFAVIEESEVNFAEGLTVLTGETGAGKSILVDALGLLAGGRADGEVIRGGCEEATVEGVFLSSPLLAERLAAHGLPDAHGEQVSIRRVLGRSGRGKAYVNGALVTVGVLAKVMHGLVDIAGQHEHMSLFDSANHRALLDRVGQHHELLATYRRHYQEMRELEERIQSLGGDERQVQSRAEFLKFQLDELDRVAPQPGEEGRLESLRKRLAAAERLRRLCAEAEALVGGDGSSLELLGRAVGLLSDGAKVDSALGESLRLLESARAELDEAARGLSRYLAGLEADPTRLAEVDERLDLIKRLCRKHALPLDQLLERRGQLMEELSQLENRQQTIAQLELEKAAAVRRASEAAAQLSSARQSAGAQFSQGVQRALQELAMAKSEFSIRVESDLTERGMAPHGADAVEFMFTANPGEAPRPLAKVASGGEASRVLLALRAAVAGFDPCQCYVLDEADAGVGGAVAEVVGRMMKEVSAHRQVLCITHLPQVAAFADHHLVVQKVHRQGRTRSQVSPLAPGDSRTRELARMLSGVEVTKEALGAAEALMRSALRSVKKVARASRRRPLAGPVSALA